MADHTSYLSEDEVQRRLKTLRKSDTIREAAEQLDGVGYPNLCVWSRRHYENHDEEFAPQRDRDISRRMNRRQRRVVKNASTAALDDIEEALQKINNTLLVERRLKMIKAELQTIKSTVDPKR